MVSDAIVTKENNVPTIGAGRHLLVRRARLSGTVKIVYQHNSEFRSKALFLYSFLLLDQIIPTTIAARKTNAATKAILFRFRARVICPLPITSR